MGSHTAGSGDRKAMETKALGKAHLEKKVKKRKSCVLLSNVEKLADLKAAWLCFIRDCRGSRGFWEGIV